MNEQIDKIREQDRIRQERYYATKKEVINARRRANYQKTKMDSTPMQESIVIDNQKPIKDPIQALTTRKIAVKSTKKESIFIALRELDLVENTKKKYIGDLTRAFTIINNEDIVKSINSQDYIKSLKNNTTFSTNTKQGMTQIILILSTNKIIKINKKPLHDIRIYNDTLKLTAKGEVKDSQQIDKIPSFTCYLDSIKKEYGSNSKMYVLSKLYNEHTLRDDFVLKIKSMTPKDTTENYIVLLKNNYVVIINSYKTDKKYGQIRVKLTKGLSNIIKLYMEQNKLQENDYLFGSEKLSDYVNYHNNKIGINGGISLFRKMKISEMNSKIMTDEERVILAEKMKHSPYIQETYLRQIE